METNIEGKLAKSTNTALIGVTSNKEAITVVVIDDDFADRTIMSRILSSVGFSIIGEAVNGMDGIEKIKELSPQLVVCDYHMPSLNGQDVLGIIKGLFPHIIFVMSTSVVEKEIVLQLLNSGVDEYLVKPIDRTKVLYKLRKLVQKHF